MSANVLTWGLNLDASGFHKSLNKATSSVQDTVGKGFGDLMAPIAKVAAAVGSVGAVMAGIKGALDLGSEMTDLSNRTGIAVENLMGLRRAFKDAGMDAEALGPAVNKMQKSLASAVGGGKEADVLKGMGLDPQSLASMDPGQAFAKIGNAIAQLPNSTERAAASIALFGRSGAELLQVFMNPNFKNAGSVSNAAKLLGENAGVFKKASDALGHVGSKLQGFFIGMASGSTNFLNKLADGIDGIDLSGIGERFGSIIGNFSTDWLSETQRIIGVITEVLIAAVNPEILLGLSEGFVAIADNFGYYLVRAFKTPLDYMQAGMEYIIQNMISRITSGPVGQAIKLATVYATEGTPGIISLFTTGRSPGLEAFNKFMGIDPNAKAQSFNDIYNQIKSAPNGAEILTSGLKEIGNSLGKDALDRIMKNITGIVEAAKKATTDFPATKAANAAARLENANRNKKQGTYDGTDIGMEEKTSIFADSLARIGGGGMFSAGGSELLSESRKQTALLTKIANKEPQPGQGAAQFSRN